MEVDMLLKRIAMMVAAGCVISLMTGCGVPQEEHDAKVGELNTAWAEIDNLNGKVTDLEALLKTEQGKVRTARIELDDAVERLQAAQQKEAVATKALAAEKSKTSSLERKVSSSKSSVMRAEERTSEVEAQLAELTVKYKEIQRRFEQFENNLKTLDGVAAPVAPAYSPETSSKSALDLLNEMSGK
jgi:DNA repair exonuclease SbcCD ATPase subunit